MGSSEFLLAMNPFRYRFSLRLRHPSMAPEDISAALGMEARFQWKAGDRRITPKGRSLDGTFESTYWCSPAFEAQGLDLADALSSHLRALESHQEFLVDFASTGGSIEYFVAWFSDGLNTGLTLNWELLKRLSALKVDLGLDVYGGKLQSEDLSALDSTEPDVRSRGSLSQDGDDGSGVPKID